MRERTLDRALIEAERQVELDEDRILGLDDLWSLHASLPVFDRLAKRASRRGLAPTQGQSHGLS